MTLKCLCLGRQYNHFWYLFDKAVEYTPGFVDKGACPYGCVCPLCHVEIFEGCAGGGIDNEVCMIFDNLNDIDGVGEMGSGGLY